MTQESKHRSYLGRAWSRFTKNRAAIVGGILISILFITAVFAPILAPYSSTAMNLSRIYEAPSREHVFGTDELGRDVLSRIIFGSRVVVTVSVSAVAIALVAGTTLGICAGYYGGIVDTLIMRVVDILLSFPAFVLALALVASFGTSLMSLIVIIALTRVPRFARIVRGTVLSVRENDYIEAARAAGASDFRILLWHVTPNSVGPVIVYATLALGASILIVSGLSFLGFGVPPPEPEWGAMLTKGREYMLSAPWLTMLPGAAIFLVVMGFNLLGDGLRDALDPTDN